MSPSIITLQGTLQADGMSVVLDKKVALPPGRVTIMVQPARPSADPTLLDMIDRIHEQQRERGDPPMSEEAMASEIAQMRAEEDEGESRWLDVLSQTRPVEG